MLSILWSAMMAAAAIQVAVPVASPTASCPSGSTVLPAGLSGWARSVPLAAGVSAGDAPALPIGSGVRATLVATSTLRLAQASGKAGTPAGFGGVFTLSVATRGRYRIALGSGAWIDVVAGDRIVASATHGHGPACSPIRKMVDFDLAPGRYQVQFTGSKTATLSLMAARVAS